MAKNLLSHYSQIYSQDESERNKNLETKGFAFSGCFLQNESASWRKLSSLRNEVKIIMLGFFLAQLRMLK